MKNYEQFISDKKINEEFFIGKLLRGLQSWVAKPLNDFTKSLSKDSDSEEIINSLKSYLKVTSGSIDNSLKTVKTVGELKNNLKQSILGIYSALKAVQSTQKVNKTFFDEIFKSSDKGLLKLINTKEMKSGNPQQMSAITDKYINDVLYPNLEKLGGVGIASANEAVDSGNPDGTGNIDESGTPQETGISEVKKKKEVNPDNKKVDDKIKSATKNWLMTIFKPIMRIDGNKFGGNQQGGSDDNYIDFGGKYKIKKDVAQGILRKSSFDDIKALRDKVGNPRDFPIQQ